MPSTTRSMIEEVVDLEIHLRRVGWLMLMQLVVEVGLQAPNRQVHVVAFKTDRCHLCAG